MYIRHFNDNVHMGFWISRKCILWKNVFVFIYVLIYQTQTINTAIQFIIIYWKEKKGWYGDGTAKQMLLLRHWNRIFLKNYL